MPGCENLSALQKAEQGAARILQRGGYKSGTGDQDQIQARGDVWDESPHRFAKETFSSVPINSRSHRSTRCHANFYARLVMSLDNQHNKRVGIGFAGTPHPLEVFRSGQAKLSLHPLSRTR
jgi:hypothetical protein